MNHEGNPTHVRKSAAIHGRDTVFPQGESMVRHHDYVGILIPLLVFYSPNKPRQLPVSIIHGDVDTFLQRPILLLVGHARRKIEGIMVGTGHEGGKEGFA